MNFCKFCGNELSPGQRDFDTALCQESYRLQQIYMSLSIPGRRPTLMGAWEYIRDKALKRSSGRCEKCGKNHQELSDEIMREYQKRGKWISNNFFNQYNHFEIHHIIPIHLGGNSLLSNLIVLCKRCHQEEHRKLRNRK